MKRLLVVLLVLLSLAGSACGSVSAPRKGVTPTMTRVLTSHYTARLSALNSSGVSGSVDFRVTGSVLIVKMQVSRLVPNQNHFNIFMGTAPPPAPQTRMPIVLVK